MHLRGANDKDYVERGVRIRVPNMSLAGPIREYVRILVDLLLGISLLGRFFLSSFQEMKLLASPRANVPLLMLHRKLPSNGDVSHPMMIARISLLWLQSGLILTRYLHGAGVVWGSIT